MDFKPLSKEEMKRVIDGKGNAFRVPVLLHFWTFLDNFEDENKASAQAIRDEFPQDCEVVYLNMPQMFDAPADDPEYRWLSDRPAGFSEEAAIDSCINMPDWSDLDSILRNFPDPYYKNLLPALPETGQYRLCVWRCCLFERHWFFRGMENALTDFYLYPDETHRLYRALTDFYKGAIVRAAKECRTDGVFTTDDIGAQTSTFFSKAIFREFFKPYYKELIEAAHENGMHFWLHSCGNIREFIPDFIEIGLDVLHPIQKYSMDEREIAKRFGKDICIWGGFDMQQTFPYGTPDDVRREVRFMMDTYFRPDGRFMITSGNGITGDCPMESLRALYEECYHYGTEKCEAHTA